jgi:hypothetical protein
MGWLEDIEEVVEIAAIESVVGNNYGSRYSRGPHIGIDMGNGDLVEDFGNGMGIDLQNGDIEFEAGNSGLNW